MAWMLTRTRRSFCGFSDLVSSAWRPLTDLRWVTPEIAILGGLLPRAWPLGHTKD